MTDINDIVKKLDEAEQAEIDKARRHRLLGRHLLETGPAVEFPMDFVYSQDERVRDNHRRAVEAIRQAMKAQGPPKEIPPKQPPKTHPAPPVLKPDAPPEEFEEI